MDDQHIKDFINKSIEVIEVRLNGIDKATVIKTNEIERVNYVRIQRKIWNCEGHD